MMVNFWSKKGKKEKKNLAGNFVLMGQEYYFYQGQTINPSLLSFYYRFEIGSTVELSS